MRRCPLSKTLEKVKKGEKGEERRKKAGKEVPVIRRNSGPIPVARGKWRGLWRAAAPGLKPLRLPRAQLQVIFRKRASHYRALLHEITSKDKASYDSTPPGITLLRDFRAQVILQHTPQE